MNYHYIIERKATGLPSLDDPSQPPLTLHWSVVDDACDVHLSGSLNWQNGICIWQSEGIEPGDWSTVMACALEAIKDCYKQMEDQAKLGLVSEPK